MYVNNFYNFFGLLSLLSLGVKVGATEINTHSSDLHISISPHASVYL